MTDQALDDLMRRVLLDALRLNWAETMEAAPSAVALSPQAQRKANALLADPFGYGRRMARPRWQQFARTAAAVFLACSLSLASLLAISPTLRAAFFRWVEEWYETHIVYRFTGEQAPGPLPAYTIATLPDGYFQTGEVVEFPGYRSVTYQNEAGQCIYLDCVQMQPGAASVVYTEDMAVHDVTVAGNPGQFYKSLDPAQGNTLVWMDSATNVQFTIDGYLEESSMLYMAESIFLETSPN